MDSFWGGKPLTVRNYRKELVMMTKIDDIVYFLYTTPPSGSFSVSDDPGMTTIVVILRRSLGKALYKSHV